MNPSASLHSAIVDRLAADADVKTEIGDPPRIYANPAQGAVFPFITLDEVSATDWSTDTWYGRTILFDVHAWGETTAAAGGKLKVYAVLRAAELALRDAPLTLTGSALVLIRMETSRVMLDPDGRTLHGVATFRAMTQEN